MIAQMEWYKILKPFRSMLKFRLPYIGENVDRMVTMDYLDGEIFFQIWPAGSSSECRLVVKENASLKTYNSIKYENQLFRFNQVERVMCYEHNINVAGLDHCYDCKAEVFVFEEYLKLSEKLDQFSNGKIKFLGSVKEYIEDLNEFLNASYKAIRITKDEKHYDLKFTDIRYGIEFEDICNKDTQTFKRRKTYLDHWKPVKRLENKQFGKVKHSENKASIFSRIGPRK